MWSKSHTTAPVRAPRQLHCPQRGVGLIEVLIAVLVLSIGLLGIAGLQARALKNSQSAYERSQAVALTYLMLDAMRANVDQARAGAYVLGRTCTPLSGGSLVANDQSAWIIAIKDTLGDHDSSCGEIACQGAVCTVRVFWDDSRGTGGSATQVVETTSQL
ncbi:type IV pilus modification protein PilV [Caldimonas taiwanensis]|uniref:type IV pilus modification protein PilV n=1 Tax=Caldimonas taiwanensis TaxID=307483 RepID=UPI000781D7B2|nr:type IV pilus modification protein PilV [Caldimonas taiwanensis]